MRVLFSFPQPTIEAAQALHEYELFNCAAVFDTGEGFVYARIHEMDSPPHNTARAVWKVIGYTLVSYHGALLDMWHKYRRDDEGYDDGPLAAYRPEELGTLIRPD